MIVDEAERTRRRRLVQAHMDAENAHDLEAILATFAPRSSNSLNLIPFENPSPQVVRDIHTLLGFGPEPGALADTRGIPQREHFTDKAIVIEGEVIGRHVGDFFGMPPSNQLITLPYVAIYTFDQTDKLASERVVMDTSRFGQVIIARKGAQP